jgi:hypothetical protein
LCFIGMRCAIDSKCHPRPHPRRLHDALTSLFDLDDSWSRCAVGAGIVPCRGVVEVGTVARLDVFDFDAAAGAVDAFQSQILSTPAGELHGSVSKGRKSKMCRLLFWS